MKRVVLALVVAFVLLAAMFAGDMAAQSGQVVQQSPARLDATSVQHSHTSSTTITVPNGGGKTFIFIDGVAIANCAGASAVTAAAPTFITTTNLPGSPQFMLGSGVTAGVCQPVDVEPIDAPIKASAVATDVTLVLPAFATNQTVSVNVFYHYGF